MYFANPDPAKYSIAPSSNGKGVLWLPMPVYPNGPGSIDVTLQDADYARLRSRNPGVANFEMLGSKRPRGTATVRIFGMATGETDIEAHRPLSTLAETSVSVSVFNLLFPKLNIWFASDHQPSAQPQDAPRLVRELNAIVKPFAGIEFRMGRLEPINLGVDVALITGTGFSPAQDHLDKVAARLRQVPVEKGTVGQLNVVIVKDLALTYTSAGYTPDQPGDISIVGERLLPPQTVVSTMAHELGHCLGVPGNHAGESDSGSLMYWAPKGVVITRQAALTMRAGAKRRR